MVKIVAISDSHTYENFEVPDGDILIHSGDISFRGTFAEMNKGMKWLGKFPHKIKIFVCGNHDFLGQEDSLLMKELAKENDIIYLENSGIEVLGLRVWGSPVSPFFNNWAFNKQRGEEIARYWKMIPDDTQILVTHGGPMGILDLVDRGTSNEAHVGCEELRKRVDELKDLRLHCFGHLHDNNGQYKDSLGKLFVNAAICNESYAAIQLPQVVFL